LLNSEPQKEAAKSKAKRTSQLRLNSIKCWTDADPDVPAFMTMDEFEIAKSLVLKVSIYDTTQHIRYFVSAFIRFLTVVTNNGIILSVKSETEKSLCVEKLCKFAALVCGYI